MNVSEEKDDGASASERQDSRTRDESPVKQERPDPCGPSSVSLRSSKSKWEPINFKKEEPIVKLRPVTLEWPHSPEPDCVSMNSQEEPVEPRYFMSHLKPTSSNCQPPRCPPHDGHVRAIA